MKKVIVTILGGALLQGCAISQKEQMDYRKYTDFSMSYIGIQKCVRDGYMSPEIGALGVRYIRSALNNYSYNSATLENEIRKNDEYVTSTQADCNVAAMYISDRKNSIQINNEHVRQQQEEWKNAIENKPKNTNCHTIGTQTFCNSY